MASEKEIASIANKLRRDMPNELLDIDAKSLSDAVAKSIDLVEDRISSNEGEKIKQLAYELLTYTIKHIPEALKRGASHVK